MSHPAVRWYAKKSARKGIALTARATGSLALLGSLRGPAVRILTYHRFGDVPFDPFCVSAADFEEQMRWLRERSLPVSLQDVQEFVAGRKVLRNGAVLVTIDDGSPCLYETALPILKTYAIPAVAFVPAGELGAPGTAGATPPSEPRITWAQLREIADAGIVVGSHAWTHQSLGGQTPATIREQMTRSRAALEAAVGRPVTAFAYPFGTFRDHDAMTAAILRETGYACAFTSMHGAVRPAADPFVLPRVKVEGGERLWMFRLLVDGALDGWRWIDRTLWRLQATGAA